MIGKPLSARFDLVPLAPERASARFAAVLGRLAAPIVEVRAQGFVACVVVDATKPAIRLCRQAGLEMAPGGSGVFGLPSDAVGSLLPSLSEAQKSWLATPAGPRETKILFVAEGFAVLAIDASDGKATILNGP